MFKDGKPYGSPCETKKSLLIGYDLMPLMGLRRMERRLATKGIVPHRCEVVSDPTSTLFAVARNGKIERDSVAWSTFCDYETTLRQTTTATDTTEARTATMPVESLELITTIRASTISDARPPNEP